MANKTPGAAPGNPRGGRRRASPAPSGSPETRTVPASTDEANTPAKVEGHAEVQQIQESSGSNMASDFNAQISRAVAIGQQLEARAAKFTEMLAGIPKEPGEAATYLLREYLNQVESSANPLPELVG